MVTCENDQGGQLAWSYAYAENQGDGVGHRVTYVCVVWATPEGCHDLAETTGSMWYRFSGGWRSCSVGVVRLIVRCRRLRL